MFESKWQTDAIIMVHALNLPHPLLLAPRIASGVPVGSPLVAVATLTKGSILQAPITTTDANVSIVYLQS